MGKKIKKNKKNHSILYDIAGLLIFFLFFYFTIYQIKPDTRLSDELRELTIELNSTSKK